MNEKLCSVIADTLGLDCGAIGPELSRESEAAWDSLNHLRLVTAVEEVFGVRFSMAQIQEIKSAGELDELITVHQES